MRFQHQHPQRIKCVIRSDSIFVSVVPQGWVRRVLTSCVGRSGRHRSLAYKPKSWRWTSPWHIYCRPQSNPGSAFQPGPSAEKQFLQRRRAAGLGVRSSTGILPGAV
eukprot:899771-Pelagomonas_calceolata.AAC.2